MLWLWCVCARVCCGACVRACVCVRETRFGKLVYQAFNLVDKSELKLLAPPLTVPPRSAYAHK